MTKRLKDHHLINVFFDPADPFYNDHFPSHPVVPGSFILQAFLNAIKDINGIKTCGTVKKIQFKSFAAPGHYQILVQQQCQTLRCQLVKENKRYAEAVFIP